MLWWLIFAVALLLIEMLTGTFYVAILSASALMVYIFSFLIPSILIQWFLFAAMAVILVFLRSKILPVFYRKSDPLPVGVHGAKGEVMESITPAKAGTVKVRGEIWTAIADCDLPTGTQIVVKEVLVSKIVVERSKT